MTTSSAYEIQTYRVEAPVSCPGWTLYSSPGKKKNHACLHPSTTYLCIPRQYRVIFKFYINILNLCNTDTILSDIKLFTPTKLAGKKGLIVKFKLYTISLNTGEVKYLCKL